MLKFQVGEVDPKDVPVRAELEVDDDGDLVLYLSRNGTSQSVMLTFDGRRASSLAGALEAALYNLEANS